MFTIINASLMQLIHTIGKCDLKGVCTQVLMLMYNHPLYNLQKFLKKFTNQLSGAPMYSIHEHLKHYLVPPKRVVVYSIL